ncbi:uncharacterized protein LOC117174849 [Belonocnema kinseyi]|uniref:uncharacterized protein LOC117174849 n=1 Tax=Belonocnema kinseyi TaxID=2817044 RepID=UPI00143D4B21|nr:uncharacterized protein LOC117174849 [Belonocnema kinseyi]
MDGKEIRIQTPSISGSLFYCYKKFHSFKLLAACDAYYRFSWVDIDDYGSVSDVSAFQSTGLYRAMERGEANLPAPARLPRSAMVLPHFFVVDEIFAVKHYSISPHLRRHPLTRRERIFNYRLFRAKNCIEDAFGILTGRWRILHIALAFKLNKSIAIVQALI